MTFDINKDIIEKTYADYDFERTCKLLGLSLSELNAYFKEYKIPRKEDNQVGNPDALKIAKYNTKFYKKHGFYPNQRHIVKVLGLPRRRVSDIFSLYNCKEVEDLNKHSTENVCISRAFAHVIGVYAIKYKLTFKEAFNSWSYNYCKKTLQSPRFAVFAYDEGNAQGGMRDLLGYFDELPKGGFNTNKDRIEVYDMIKKEYV